MENLLSVIVGLLVGAGLTLIKDHVSYRRNNLSEIKAKEILEDTLSHRSFTDRSFFTLTNRVGGFTDDQVRRLLLEIGAQKVMYSKREHKEWWYLKERSGERIDRFNARSEVS